MNGFPAETIHNSDDAPPEVATRNQSRDSDLAGRNTPLMTEYWYVGAWADEITEKPLGRVILNQRIVFFRDRDNKIAALHDRCPHRSYPLSAGVVQDGNIVCGYHGVQFAPDGRCALVPATGTAPGALRVRAYPVVEQGPFVWIWMGDPDHVRHDRFVDQPWFVEPEWTHVKGYFHMQAHYLGLHENLMDLSHFPFLHGSVLARPEHASARPKVSVQDNVVCSALLHEDVPVSPRYRELAHFTGQVDRHSLSRVPTPAIHVGLTEMRAHDRPNEQHMRYIIHCPTPATEHETHYFWAIARNQFLDDALLDAESEALGNKAFLEDKVALEAIEHIYLTDPDPDVREKLLPSDAAGVQLLRAFARMEREDRKTGVRGA